MYGIIKEHMPTYKNNVSFSFVHIKVIHKQNEISHFVPFVDSKVKCGLVTNILRSNRDFGTIIIALYYDM